jgi:hypothetical protein
MLKSAKYYGEYMDGGSRNSFYAITGSEYGFKSFPSKELAEFAHAVQDNLSKYNLTPLVHSQVGRIRIPQYDYVNGAKTKTDDILSDWGYLTEVADPYECGDEECCGCAYDDNCKNFLRIKNVLIMASNLGIEYSDSHNGNLGIVVRKKKKFIVIIDLGRESIHDYDRSLYPDVYDIGDDEYEGWDSGCSCTACREAY